MPRDSTPFFLVLSAFSAPRTQAKTAERLLVGWPQLQTLQEAVGAQPGTR